MYSRTPLASAVGVSENYLAGLQSKYEYDSVFLISSKTNLYYHFEGIKKTVSRENKDDEWYYKFIESKKSYDVDVDFDEADNENLTIFINCRIVDSDGSLMGVVGVGIKMDQLQEILNKYEKNYDLKAFLIDSSGLIQAHTDSTIIKKMNLFYQPPIGNIKKEILENQDSFGSYWLNSGSKYDYLLTRHINDLNWYLVVQKDTSVIGDSLLSQIWQNMFIITAIIVTLLMLSSYVISRYNKMMTKLATTDVLTDLPNRRSINELLQKEIEQHQRKKDAIVFIFDIDYFKVINDTHGHLFGDEIIKQIGQIAKGTIGDSGLVARWGGDEFIGILYGTVDEADKMLASILDKISTLDKLKKYDISISVGATQIKQSDNLDTILARADNGLYQSKKNGRKQITFL